MSGALAWLIQHWRLALALAMAIALHLQTERLEAAQQALQDKEAAEQLAQARGEAHAAKTGLEAVTDYADETKKAAPVVERVVYRTRNLCLRQPADHQLPGGAGDLHALSAGAGDDEDRTFADALARDIATCNDQLNILRGFQQWKRENGG